MSTSLLQLIRQKVAGRHVEINEYIQKNKKAETFIYMIIEYSFEPHSMLLYSDK